MTPPDRSDLPAPGAARAAAFGVHLLTASGAGLALVALTEAVHEHWAAMFGWLGAALVVDAIDGPLARRLDVARLTPEWSGDMLDLVVDFVTYVFVPAYAIVAGGVLAPSLAPWLGAGIAVSAALYFADRRMKTADNHFRGFPALWNTAAFYLFLVRPPAFTASLGVAALIALTFVPFNVIHPVRVARLRPLNIALMLIWGALAIVAVAQDFRVTPAITVGLCLIGLYVMLADTLFRLLRPVRA